MHSKNLTVLNPNDEGISHYLAEVKKFPILTQEEEIALTHEMHENKSLEAAHKLISSHLRLVVSVALRFKGYGLPITDLIAEGNIGLMNAVKKFDPSKGFRLSTYAIWWIRASIQNYILKSWSIVKIGTTVAQKKLFFSLNKIKNKLSLYGNGDLSPDTVNLIANDLNVPDYEVIDMNRRLLGSDASLNVPALTFEQNSAELQDMIQDERPTQDLMVIEKDEQDYRQQILDKALDMLPERDRDILIKRKIKDPAETLDAISQEYNISRERVRQIENRAFENLKKNVLLLANPHVKKQITHDK